MNIDAKKYGWDADDPGMCLVQELQDKQMTVTDGTGEILALVDFDQEFGTWIGKTCTYEGGTVDLPQSDFYVFTLDDLDGEVRLTDLPSEIMFETYHEELTQVG